MTARARQAEPKIAIVLPTDSAETIQPVLRCLETLNMGARLEIVIVIPDHQPVSDLIKSNVRVTTVPSIYPLAGARAAGVRAATAPYVFMGETHSFPRPGMLEAIIDAHEKGATIVVPAFENENPGSAVSWACFLNGYAPWTDWRNAGRIGYAPLFNVSYVREFLTELGASLDTVLLTGEDMMLRVRSANGYAAIETTARIGHMNIAHARDWLPQRIVAGRVIASIRSARWPIAQRLVYALGAPLIPVVLLWRHRHGIIGTMARNDVSLAVFPLLALGMCFQAVGELIGYAVGPSDGSSRRYDWYEIQQLKFS